MTNGLQHLSPIGPNEPIKLEYPIPVDDPVIVTRDGYPTGLWARTWWDPMKEVPENFIKTLERGATAKGEVKPVKILSIGDMHCGNVAGLTPDQYNMESEDGEQQFLYRQKLYHWFREKIAEQGPFDICVVNGDVIDGKGIKSGGNEQIYSSRPKQIEMAVELLKEIPATNFGFTFGTGYHVGPEDDWEIEVAREFGETPKDVLVKDVNGLIMKWRHHIGGSIAPTGRANAPTRQQEWDILWSLDGEFERANVLVFNHVHYFQSQTNRFGTWFTSPGLLGLGGSQLGSRRMGGTVDYGFLTFEVKSKEDWSWKAHLLKQTPDIR